jgi:hypothetical protein
VGNRTSNVGDAVVDALCAAIDQSIPGGVREDSARCQPSGVRGKPISRSLAQSAAVEQDDACALKTVEAARKAGAVHVARVLANPWDPLLRLLRRMLVVTYER